MLFRTHVLFGVISFFILDLVLEMPVYVLIGVLVGSVFVDLDCLKSKVGRRFWFLSFWFRHRGFLHSLIGALIFSSVVGLFDLWIGFGFFVGYVSHLVLDCLTWMGVRLFWPFDFKVRGFVRSGDWVEDVLFVLFLFSDIVFVVYKFL
ncbi:metal-dependent hydrolase [Methanococcoides sp. SA1]|nr:metal-dependent hydrolase [Methanococcoides sp. SA1]